MDDDEDGLDEESVKEEGNLDVVKYSWTPLLLDLVTCGENDGNGGC